MAYLIEPNEIIDDGKNMLGQTTMLTLFRFIFDTYWLMELFLFGDLQSKQYIPLIFQTNFG